MDSPIFLTGSGAPQTPLVVAIPHASRTYPTELKVLARLDAEALRPLEDRFADLLAGDTSMRQHQQINANVARAWIDLNRREDEIDIEMITTADRHRFAPRPTSKVRGGLGLIPRRIAAGEIWNQPLTADDIEARISAVHRPYHAAITDAVTATYARFGVAILVDLHSMPPASSRNGDAAPHLVFGDLFGQSASLNFVERACNEGRDAGFRVARNVPYAGGYTLALHGKPIAGVHALQIEVARDLYLDESLDQPGPGLKVMSRFIARLANALIDEALATDFALAAE